MTLRNEVTPAHVLIDYTWDLLKANTSMLESKYGGLLPIVPVAEEPALAQYDEPYLVYGYVLNPSNDLYPMKYGSITFVVYSTLYREIGLILNVMRTAFEKFDESANNINQWSSLLPHFRGMRFSSTSVGLVEGGTPEADDTDSPSSEGGRMSGMINIRFQYFSDNQVKIFRPVGNSSGTIISGTWS